MKTLDEIRSILHSRAEDLYGKFGITELAVFGSVVRNEAHEGSDIDILATFERPVGLIKLISAEDYIAGLLGAKVDLIPREEVRPELRERIESESVPV